jgi:hypothetical protein
MTATSESGHRKAATTATSTTPRQTGNSKPATPRQAEETVPSVRVTRATSHVAVLDGQPRDACRDRESDAFGDALRVVCETRLEVGVDGERDRLIQLREVGEDFAARQPIVGTAVMWFNLASAMGETTAAEQRDKLAQRMTPAQVAKAEKLAREWKPTSTPAQR